ncbi:MAG TPA: hypothetical protein PLF42_00875 [Anaerolineales bacterium]|nr:hypothetical protein [Anaerolineales bacterium]
MFDKKVPATISLTLILLLLLACGVFTTPPPAISGQLDPWTEDTPIDGRNLALCQLDTTEGTCGCTLSNQAIATDDYGEFEVYDVPAGEYMFLYDSGLNDFAEALDKWGGTELRFCDPEWADEYFKNYAHGWAKFHTPKGVNIGNDKIMAYAQFSLGLGNSPFIVAHVLGETYSDGRILQPIIVEVTEGSANNITIPIVYYGEK